jgi:hypothetical protein
VDLLNLVQYLQILVLQTLVVLHVVLQPNLKIAFHLQISH